MPPARPLSPSSWAARVSSNGVGNQVGVVLLALVGARASVDQAEHAVLEEAPGLRTDRIATQARNPAALGDGLIGQHDATDDLIIVLNGVRKAQGELLKALCGRHDLRPFPLSVRAGQSTRGASFAYGR